MKPYYDHAGITIYHGDCREVVNDIQPGSVPRSFHARKKPAPASDCVYIPVGGFACYHFTGWIDSPRTETGDAE